MAELVCGVRHLNIDEAISHAKENLIQSGKKRGVVVYLSVPVWGMKGGSINNIGKVIGYQTEDGWWRWRLDYDPVKGVHVNEEEHPPGVRRRVVHRVETHITLETSEAHMQLYWNKWTSRYDVPADVQEKADFLKRR